MPSIKEALPPFPNDIDAVPLFSIDYAKLKAADEIETQRFFKACQELGFFYLANSGIDPSEMFSVCDDFYNNTSEEEKKKYDMGETGNYYGMKMKGSGIVDSKGTPDSNEFFNLSKDDLLGNDVKPLPKPPVLEQNKDKVATYMRQCHSVIITLLEIISTSLGIPANTLPDIHRIDHISGDMIRLIKAYNPTVQDEQQCALGEHTDFGSITILYNNLGGLQLKDPTTDTWRYVKPVPGSPIINLGDACVKLTNGLLRSNIHRVVRPPGEQAKHVRYSIVYFSRPEDDIKLAPLKGSPLIKADAESDKEALTSKEWIANRVKYRRVANFSKESFNLGSGTEGERLTMA